MTGAKKLSSSGTAMTCMWSWNPLWRSAPWPRIQKSEGWRPGQEFIEEVRADAFRGEHPLRDVGRSSGKILTQL
jgi:hypothetical protein